MFMSVIKVPDNLLSISNGPDRSRPNHKGHWLVLGFMNPRPSNSEGWNNQSRLDFRWAGLKKNTRFSSPNTRTNGEVTGAVLQSLLRTLLSFDLIWQAAAVGPPEKAPTRSIKQRARELEVWAQVSLQRRRTQCQRSSDLPHIPRTWPLGSRLSLDATSYSHSAVNNWAVIPKS